MRFAALAAAALMMSPAPGFPQGVAARGPSVPAIYVRDVRLPGGGDVIGKPTVLHYDRFHDEVYVGDSGHNRILIFGSDSVFRFEFTLGSIMTSPRDITTDPDGFIYVLGSMPRGPVLHRFDFDGVPVNSIDIPEQLDGERVSLRQLACDGQGTLYALDHAGRRILTFDRDGAVSWFPVIERETVEGPRQPEQMQPGFALGTLSCADGVLYIPVGDMGKVLRFTTDGRALGSIGHFGSEPGTLNFPIAAEVSPEGLILVLDRPRYCVVCYHPDGRFLGEFGGRGIRSGWFMGPSLLAVPSAEEVIVGQYFRSRIQVCQLPPFIREKLNYGAGVQWRQDSRSSIRSSAESESISERRLSDSPRTNVRKGGDASPSTMNSAQLVHQATHPEVYQ